MNGLAIFCGCCHAGLLRLLPRWGCCHVRLRQDNSGGMVVLPQDLQQFVEVTHSGAPGRNDIHIHLPQFGQLSLCVNPSRVDIHIHWQQDDSGSWQPPPPPGPPPPPAGGHHGE